MVPESLDSTTAEWGEQTYKEIRSIGQQDGSVLLIPIGSIEQHGNHLPVATDTILVDAIAKLGIDRVSGEVPILKTPPFWSGYSPHHLGFGGTLSLDFDVIIAAIENIADSALQNGFDALLLLNGHGGNMSLISTAVSTIGEENDDVEVLGLTYFRLANEFIDDIRESDIGGMSHGGEFETSLMLYLRKDLVDETSIDAQPLEEPYERGTQDLVDSGPVHVYREFEEYSSTGAIGEPEFASAEKGESIYRLLGDEIESFIQEIHQQNV